MTIELTEALARFSVGTPAARIPAFDKAVMCIVDRIGCILAEASSEVAEPLLETLHRADAAGGITMLGTAHRAAAVSAALPW